MNRYKTIEIENSDRYAVIWLNRPEKHNAINADMIFELTDALKKLNNEDGIRAILIRGKGKSFCAGADLNWMKDVETYTYEENVEDSLKLANCFYTIYNSSIPTIAVVHGAVYGGANGILASCDMAFCEEETVFSFSEVKIGIIPATISPYIIKRIGEYPSRELMFTGKRIKGEEAESYGLVNKSLKADKLETHIASLLKELMTSGPKAVSECKKLIDHISKNTDPNETLSYTAKTIAGLRSSEEGREGMDAFLQKRKAKWIK